MPKAPSTAAEFFQHIHPEDLPALQHRAQLALEGNSRFEAAFRMLGPDGQLRWMADFGIAKRNSAGQAVRLLGTIKDITEDRRTSEVLRESEEKFRQLAENIQQVFWMTSPSKDRMEYVSPAFEAIWGCPVKDLYAQPWLWLESIHPEDRPRVQRTAATHQVTGDYDEQYRIVRPDGQERWIQDRAFPVCDAAGRVVRLAGIAKDITDRKQEEQQIAALVRELATLKTALDEHAIVAITNSTGRIQYVNDLFCAVSKYSREELLGQDHRIVNSGHHSKDFIRDLWTTISAGRVWKGEIRNRAKDGSFYWVDTTIVPMLNEASQPSQYVAIRADITARKQSEAALRDLNADLEQRVLERTAQLAQALEREKELGALKSRFISMASHEFRTPLTAIQASSDLLKHYGERMTTGQKLERLDKIQAEVRNMTALLEDVLFVGRSGAGRIPFDPEPLDFSSACQELCLEMGAALQVETDIEFTTNRAGVLVPTDMKLLRHIVTNLLSNAVKYSRGAEPVQMHLQFDADRVVMSVRDHGIGIPADDLPRLFESFHRAANVHDIPGTGLGLAIVKHSVELHGGQVKAHSEIGRGSEFTVTFPLPASKFP